MNGKIEIQSKKQHFNIIDLLIILAALATVGSVVFRKLQTAAQEKPSQLADAEISFYSHQIERPVSDAIRDLNGEIVLYWNDLSFGTVKNEDTDIQKTISYVEMQDGTLQEVSNDLYFDVRGIIRAKVTKTDRGYMINGVKLLSPGQILTVHSQNVTFTLQVLDITVPEGK